MRNEKSQADINAEVEQLSAELRDLKQLASHQNAGFNILATALGMESGKKLEAAAKTNDVAEAGLLFREGRAYAALKTTLTEQIFLREHRLKVLTK
ncbi:MAG: hypothetical protein QM729_21505 [Solirubrobacterales bacterium]